ncbi:unnamed protein product [Adineta steineri]|uniref:G-protein coupled receptors family 1 profile domain-containing protein n=1 Tax=Adineta steineri TaxID=433720 RepID=A0A818VW16_9BILA|nr:unnamed protein product [Adineta steineri]
MSAQILDVATKYQLYSATVMCPLGVVGNAINILVFTQLKLFRENRCAFYLTVESIFNIFYLLFLLTVYILTSVYGNDRTGSSFIWCRLNRIIAQTFGLTPFTMICFTTVDEYFSTNYLYNLRYMCTLKLARYLTFVFICIWLVHSIIFGLFSNIVPSGGCTISNEVYLRYTTYFTNLVLTGPLPLVISLLFGLLAYQNVRRLVRRQIPVARRRLDRQITAMCFIRVIAFACSGTPYFVSRVYALIHPVSRSEPLKFTTMQLIQVIFASIASLNFGISFYLFIISSSHFRRQVKFVLVKKCWKRLKYLCCSGNIQITPENIEPNNSNIELEEIH